jgi:hypothetical protein
MNPDPASQLPWGLLAALLAASLCAGAIGSMAERSLMTGNKGKVRSQDLFALRGMTLFSEFAALLFCYALFRAPLAEVADSLELPSPVLIADLAWLFLAGYANPDDSPEALPLAGPSDRQPAAPDHRTEGAPGG